ncbi:hypothetical protein D3C72_2180880 [compost metagenome]
MPMSQRVQPGMRRVFSRFWYCQLVDSARAVKVRPGANDGSHSMPTLAIQRGTPTALLPSVAGLAVRIILGWM